MAGDYEQKAIDARNFPIGVSQHKLRPVINCALCHQIGVFIKTADDVLQFLMEHECDGGSTSTWENEKTGSG